MSAPVFTYNLMNCMCFLDKRYDIAYFPVLYTCTFVFSLLPAFTIFIVYFSLQVRKTIWWGCEYVAWPRTIILLFLLLCTNDIFIIRHEHLLQYHKPHPHHWSSSFFFTTIIISTLYLPSTIFLETSLGLYPARVRGVLQYVAEIHYL
jgi:hypothetical protein